MKLTQIIATIGLLCATAIRAQEASQSTSEKRVSSNKYVTLSPSPQLPHQDNIVALADELSTTTITNVVTFTSFYCPICKTMQTSEALPTTTITNYVTSTSTYCPSCKTLSLQPSQTSPTIPTKTITTYETGNYPYTTTVSTQSTYVVGSDRMTTPEKIYHVHTPIISAENDSTNMEKGMSPTIISTTKSGVITRADEYCYVPGCSDTSGGSGTLSNTGTSNIAGEGLGATSAGSRSYSKSIFVGTSQWEFNHSKGAPSHAVAHHVETPGFASSILITRTVGSSPPVHLPSGVDITSSDIPQNTGSDFTGSTVIPFDTTSSNSKPQKNANTSAEVSDASNASKEATGMRTPNSLSSVMPALSQLHADTSDGNSFQTFISSSTYILGVQPASTLGTWDNLSKLNTPHTSDAIITTSGQSKTGSLLSVATIRDTSTDRSVVVSDLLSGFTSTLSKSMGDVATSSRSDDKSSVKVYGVRTLATSIRTHPGGQDSPVDSKQQQQPTSAIVNSTPASHPTIPPSASVQTSGSIEVGSMIGEFTGAASRLNKISIKKLILVAAFFLV